MGTDIMSQSCRALSTAVLIISTLSVGALAEDVEQIFQSIYGAKLKEVRSTPDTTDDVRLAKQLLQGAASVKNATLLAKMCDHAYALANRVPDELETAVAAMELLATGQPARLRECLDRIVVIRQRQYVQTRGAGREAAGNRFAAALLDLSAAHETAGELARSVAALRRAMSPAILMQATNRRAVRARFEDASARLRTETTVRDLTAILDKSPDDQAASRKLIHVHVVDLDNPAAARPLLATAGDAKLTDRVEAASKDVSDVTPAEARSLGNWYRELATDARESSKATMLHRAQVYYQRFLSLHQVKDLQRTAAQLALDDVRSTLNRLGVAAPPAATGPIPRPDLHRNLRPGLLKREFWPIEAQTKDKGGRYVHPDQFGEPVGESKVAATLTPWNYTQNRNGVATGFLQVPVTGTYVFNSNSFYDRNALFLDGKLVCGFRDGEGKQVSVQLSKGLVPIMSVGYIHARGNARVRWKPPGADGLMPIPADLLFHRPQ